MIKNEYKKVQSAIRRAQYMSAKQPPVRTSKARLIDALINVRSHGINPYSKLRFSKSVNVRFTVRSGLKSDEPKLTDISVYVIRKRFDYFAHSQSQTKWRHPILADGKMGSIWDWE